MAKLSIEEIIEAIKELSVLELNDLVTAAEEVFGVSAAAGVVMSGAGDSGDSADEKTDFDVELTSFGDKKIQVIKIAKDVLGVGLKEAKEFVESAPAMIKEGVGKDEAEELKAKLEEAGATVTLK